MNPKQKLFCAEYLKDLNATEAAKRAGYTENRSKEMGYQLLHKPALSAYVQAEMAKREKRISLSADKVLNELARIAFLDPRKFYDKEGNLKKIQDLDDDTAAVLAGVEVDTKTSKDETLTTTKKIRYSDKVRALELLAKYYKLLTERIETTIKVQTTSFDFSKLPMDDLTQLRNLLAKIPQKEVEKVEK